MQQTVETIDLRKLSKRRKNKIIRNDNRSATPR